MADVPSGARTHGAVARSLHVLATSSDRYRAAMAHAFGLGSTDVVALVEIGRRPGLRPGELARTLGLGVGGTSSVVDKLVRAGHVVRGPDPDDRRGVNLHLTDSGREAFAAIADAVDATLDGALGDDVDHAPAVELLGRIAAAFDASGPDVAAAARQDGHRPAPADPTAQEPS